MVTHSINGAPYAFGIELVRSLPEWTLRISGGRNHAPPGVAEVEFTLVLIIALVPRNKMHF